MISAALLARLPSDAPLNPSPDKADSLLRRELLRPEYHDQNPMEQFLHWLQRQLDTALDKASSAPPLGWFGAIVVFLLVLLLLGWLVSRARHTASTPREAGPVLSEEHASAADLRARALAALAAGDATTAVVEGFRALTLRQIEVGVLEDQPGATAHEVSISLAASFPDRRDRIEAAAALFDLVLYGDRPATTDQARAVLALDDDLVPVR